MKPLKQRLLRAGCLPLLLMLGATALRAQPQTTYTFHQVKDDQRTFLAHIRDAENECTNGVVRRGENNRLWQNNIMKADLQLKVVFALMDGNDKVTSHQAKIGNLKKAVREAYWVNNFTTNYLALRNRAYALQNKVDPFIAQLDPALKAWLEKAREQIRNSDDPEKTGLAPIQQTSGTSLPAPTGGSDVSGGRSPIGNLVRHDGNPIGGDGPGGPSAPGGPGAPPGAGGPGGPAPKAGDTIFIGGKPASGTDIRELFDENGNLKKKFLKVTYTDAKGGHIDTEVMLKNEPQKRPDGGWDIAQSGEDGTKISWLLGIKESNRTPAGLGFTATYQLINEGTPADAQFDVTAWEGPGGRKDSADTSFTVTLPNPGHYEIKVYGQTKQYGSPFTITVPVDF
jgi:hypothetical protein